MLYFVFVCCLLLYVAIHRQNIQTSTKCFTSRLGTKILARPKCVTTSSKWYYPFDGFRESYLAAGWVSLHTQHTSHTLYAILYILNCCSAPAVAYTLGAHTLAGVLFDFERGRRNGSCFTFMFFFFLFFKFFRCLILVVVVKLHSPTTKSDKNSNCESGSFGSFGSFFFFVLLILFGCVCVLRMKITKLDGHACTTPIEPNDGTCFNYNRIYFTINGNWGIAKKLNIKMLASIKFYINWISYGRGSER